ncbi:TPA: hypothetical protein ACUPQ2_004484 [Escherichia coli]
MDAGYGSFNNSVASGKWEQRNNQNVDLFYFDNCSDCSLFFSVARTGRIFSACGILLLLIIAWSSEQ